MTPGEFKEIAKAMQEFGISYVKMRDCEISRGPQVPQVAMQNHTVSNWPNPNSTENNSSDPIRHKVDQMTSMMKLSDTELVDQLFPDQTDEIA